MSGRLRGHLAALNAHFDGLSSETGPAVFSAFKLDEETVSFKVACGEALRGEVSLSLYERSAYPRTGGLAFAEGSDALVSALEAISEKLNEQAAIDFCLRSLAGKLPSPPAYLSEQLLALPSADSDSSSSALAAATAGSSSSGSGAAAASSNLDDEDDEMEEDDEHDDDDDDDDDMQANLDYDFARGAELENSLLRLRHQWELKDQARREAADKARADEEAAAAAAAAAASASASAKRKRMLDGKAKGVQKQGAHQIFSSAEATRMLCNELFDLMKEEREGFDGVSADCIDFNIHKWRVAISDISEGCALHSDLEKVSERYGYKTIELELGFTPDMHPFYPVFVKVVRPRFVGVVAEAVMTHPAMTLQGWDPMKRIKWLIRMVQAFLEQHGRVDLDDSRNDRTLHPDGAYTAAEWAICRLELLAQVAPVWASREPALLASRSADVDLERIRELNYGKKKEKLGGAAAKQPWESGIGYGHSGTEGQAMWDVVATEKAQAQVDIEMREMIVQVTEFTRRGELRHDLLHQSCLRPLLWRQLHTASLLDVGSRPERMSMYMQMLALVRAIAAWPNLRATLAEPTGQTAPPGQPVPSVLTALEGVRRQAEFFHRTSTSAASAATSSSGSTATVADEEMRTTRDLAAEIMQTAAEIESCRAAAPADGASGTPGRAGGASADATAAATGAGVAAAARAGRTTRHATAVATAAATAASVAATSAAAATATASAGKGTRGKGAAAAAAAEAAPSLEPGESSRGSGGGGSSSSDGGVGGGGGLDADQLYESTMRDLSFDSCDSILGHYYEKKSEGKEASGSTLAARTRRLCLESSDMMGGALPVSVSSSIWARVKESAMHYWRAMISGPEGTPYASGIFVFDILCPSEYPNVAPKVNLQTTGGGSVRFNPNLYNCGKVCLSLLGTWQGDQGESWHPKTSTLLQVLMSVQALILVPDPFFNEPGYERTRGTPEGDRQSRAYNETIREATIRYAMIEQIKKPSAELKQPIIEHFRMRRDAILAQVKGWAGEKENSPRHAGALATLIKDLEAAMQAHL